MSHVNLTNKISTKNIKFYIYNPFSKKNDQLKKIKYFYYYKN